MDTMLRNGTGSSKGSTLPDRLALYKQMDETRHEELSNLAQAVMTLEDKLRTAKADLEDEQMTRRQYRRRAEEAESAAVSEPYPTRACFTYRWRRMFLHMPAPAHALDISYTDCFSLGINLP